MGTDSERKIANLYSYKKKRKLAGFQSKTPAPDLRREPAYWVRQKGDGSNNK